MRPFRGVVEFSDVHPLLLFDHLIPPPSGSLRSPPDGGIITQHGSPRRSPFPSGGQLLLLRSVSLLHLHRHAIFEGRQTLVPGGPKPYDGLLRQMLHGDHGYDDPVEVLKRVGGSSAAPEVEHLYPVVDHSGTGSLQAVLGADGNLIERVLYGSAWGAKPKYLQGPLVENAKLEAEKDGSGNLRKVTAEIRLTEKIAESSLPGMGIHLLKADGSEASPPTGSLTLDSKRPNVLVWSVSGAEWQSWTSASGAATLEIAVTDQLRAEGWGETPVMPAPEWATTLYGVKSSASRPWQRRESLATLATELFDKTAAGATRDREIYAIPDLYLAASPDSKTQLLTGFQSAPYVEPANGMAQFRARWYDPETGTWLSPDPLGYGASGSNLYSYAHADPVNGRDPTGELCETSNASGVFNWLQRCGEDMFNVQQDFSEGILLHPLKTGGRAVAGVVGTGKMIGKAAIGITAMVVDQQLARTGDVNAMMRQGQRVMAMGNALRHPIDTVVKAHTDMAENVLAHEQKGEWFQASIEAGETGAADAAAIAGATEIGISLGRFGTRLLTRTAAIESGAAGGTAAGAEAAAGPTGDIYSVMYQTELRSTSYPGLSRAAHFQEANEALLTTMEANPEFATALRQAGVNLERTPTGLAPRTSPQGWTWHHAQQPGVMQLVPRLQHTAGSIFWDAFHPGGIGGFAIWGR